MDSFWVKMAVFGAIVGGLIFLVMGLPEKAIEDIEENTPSFRDVAKEDTKRLSADPVFEEEETIDEEPEIDSKQEEPIEPVRTKTVKKEFRELTEAEDIHAEQLLAYAIQGRSIGRLPMAGFKLLVDNCRQIITKYPDTIYEYKARRALGEIPERYWSRYKITEEEVIIEN